MKFKSYSLYLYYKQGEDLSYHVSEGRGPMGLAEQLTHAVEQLKILNKFMQENDVEVQGDTNCIFVECDDDIADKMIAAGLDLHVEEHEDEDENFDETCIEQN